MPRLYVAFYRDVPADFWYTFAGDALISPASHGDKDARTDKVLLIHVLDSYEKGYKTMNVSEEALLKSGFNSSDLRKIKNNIESYGGKLGEAVQDLANKFRVLIWISSACTLVFIFLLLFASEPTIVGGGLSLLIAVIIVTFIQPPVLAWKSWRYWRFNRV